MLELEDGRKKLQVRYSFNKEPQSIFLAEGLNHLPPLNQAMKAFKRFENTIGTEEMKKLFTLGVEEDALKFLPHKGLQKVMLRPHTFIHQQLTHNPQSKSNKIVESVKSSNTFGIGATTVFREVSFEMVDAEDKPIYLRSSLPSYISKSL